MKPASYLQGLILLLFGVGLFVASSLDSSAQVTFTQQQSTLLNNTNYTAQSASLADVDNDGDLDILFAATNGARLHTNNLIGTGTFNFAPGVLLTGTTEAWSAAWGDYDSNGFVDVFVGQENNAPMTPTPTGDVLKNDGGTFTNPSDTIGLADPGFHQSVAWADIDSDHDLDLLIAMEGPTEKHEIYQQNANGTFTAIGASVGFQAPAGVKAYGMAIGDTDGDGDLDVYISTCRGDNNIRNNFFENQLAQTGTLSFVDIAGDYTGDVTTGNGTQVTTNTYGTEFHDFDDDGDLDLYVIGADRQPTKFYRNDGGNQFTDVDSILGGPVISDTGGDYNGARAVDYDNDGDLDLFVHDHLAGTTNYARRLFENRGNWQFVDVTNEATKVVGLDTQGNQGGYDSAWGDLDNDGDLDLVAATNSSWNERVFTSDASTNGNHWLHINLAGPGGNSTGIGAAIYATIYNGAPDETTMRRDANANAGAFNQNDIPVHFGLGGATVIDQLRVHWPDGTEQYLFDVPVDQYMTIAYAGELPGDFTGDGIVDVGDYVLWRKGVNDMYTERDFELWRANFGRTIGGGFGSDNESVAEPAGGVLLLGLAAVLGRLRRR